MPLEAGGYPIYPDESDCRYPPEGVDEMTPHEHLAEIARLADEMRPHMEALPGAFSVTVNPTSWTSPLDVQLNETKDVVALVPTATPYATTTDDKPSRHCFVTVDGVRLSACDLNVEVPADV